MGSLQSAELRLVLSIMISWHRSLIAALCTLLCATSLNAFQLPASSKQCIVGIADGWNSSHVELRWFEKRAGKWQPVGAPWPGRLGKNGLIWGLGLHPVPKGAKTKIEGDMRSPAGVFRLGGVWGYAEAIQKHPKLAYRHVTPRDLWVEDPESPSYNLNVILPHDPKTDWERKQQMHQNDAAHSLKWFIAHNAEPNIIPNAGSSIFFHIWRRGGAAPTAGCTTMSEAKLKQLIALADPQKMPLFVLLPRAEYERLAPIWKLP